MIVLIEYNEESRSFSIDRNQLQSEIKDLEDRINSRIERDGDIPASINIHLPHQSKPRVKKPGFRGTKEDQKRYKDLVNSKFKPLIRRNTIIGATVGTGVGAGIGALATRNMMNRLANRHPDWTYDQLKKRTKLIRGLSISGGAAIGGTLGGITTNKMTKFDINSARKARFQLDK